MCEWGHSKTVHVIRRNHPAIADGWHEMEVDSCISDYIQEMNDRGIITLSCCCGHNGSDPNVLVAYESEPLLTKFKYSFEPYDGYSALIHYIR